MQHELNKDVCLVCGAKHSITREIHTVDYKYRVHCVCAVCSSEYAGLEEFRLSKLLNKPKEKPNEL